MNKSEVIIKGKDGKILDRFSYKNDPKLIKQFIIYSENIAKNITNKFIAGIQSISKDDKEDKQLKKDIVKLTEKSESFEFLGEEEELYNEKDLIEKY